MLDFTYDKFDVGDELILTFNPYTKHRVGQKCVLVRKDHIAGEVRFNDGGSLAVGVSRFKLAEPKPSPSVQEGDIGRLKNGKSPIRVLRVREVVSYEVDYEYLSQTGGHPPKTKPISDIVVTHKKVAS